MALMTTAASTPSGDSHSSSPELSPEMDPSVSTSATSPLSLPASLNKTQDEPERGNESGRSTPARSPQDLTRSRPPTRGGCWTCRIRRKKCDEERVDGDSCKTCKRLGIECLGWGSRRPEWMRDKEQVAQYKAGIKEKLTRAGLIRGQPRAMYTQLAGPSTSSSSTTTHPSTTSTSRAGIRGSSGIPSVVPHDRYPHSAMAGPGPSTTTTLRSRRIDPYSPYGTDLSTPYPSRPSSSMMSALPGLDNMSMSGTTNPDMSLPPFVMPPQTTYATHPMPSPSLYGTSSLHPQPTNSDMFSSTTTSVSPYPSPHSMFDVSPLSHPPPPSVSPVNNTTNNTPRMMSPMVEPTDQLVAYYFEHVRKLQFAFAGQELTQVLYLVLQRDPHGPLKHAICALASLHSTKLQMHGFDEETSGARPMHKRYFDQGHYVLLQRRPSSQQPSPMNHTNPEDDALGAVFLIGYYMMVGGGRNWLKLLDIACDWFATQSGLVEEQNPKLKLWNMTDAQRLAVKTVMWIDIQSSIIFTSTPRFLAVYRRLLGSGGGGFWGTTTPSSTLTGTDRTTDLRMDKLTGCPDEAVLALAESAHLASWKQHHQAHGTLSVRELVGRADQIEQTLRQTQAVRSVSSSPVNEVGPSGGLLPSGLPAAASDMFGGAGTEMDEAARRAIPQVWRETAILYLHTVLSDALPGVLEIQKSVSTLGDWFNGFTASPLDRSVLLPLILTATLTDNVIMHDIVKGRIALHGGDMMFNGAMAQAARFVEYVWQRRRARPQGVPVDWRECMQERWSSLVMV